MIDPSKDKLAYFKDNIQTAEDKEEFDASQYYYHRDEYSSGGKSLGSGSSGLGSATAGLNMATAFHSMGSGSLSDGNGVFSGFSSSGMMSAGPSSFLGASTGRAAMMSPASHELHRMNSGDHLAAVIKGRAFPLQETKAPDMSEFPALGARMGSMSLDDSMSDSRLRTQPSEFVIQKEDFPALSPFAGPNSNDKSSMQPSSTDLKRHSSFTASVNDGLATPVNTNGSLIGSRTGGTTAAGVSPLRGGGAGGSSVNYGGAGLGHLNARSSNNSSSNSSSSPSGGGELDPTNTFGLLGMLHTVIRPGSDAKKNLAMGCDLTSLGLNLNSSEPLNPTFAAPWADGPLTKEPQFSLPMCYYNQPPVLKTTHLSKFHLETLFYIFYSMPKDVLQAYAAQELYSREWRYHMELKMWLKRASPADQALLLSGGSGGLASSTTVGSGSVGSIGSAPSSSSSSSSAAVSTSLGPQFLYFDATTWERRVFTGNFHSVSAGLMSEEEIRVKFNAAT